MNQAGFSRPGPREPEIASPYAARLASAARSATPALLYGLRLWAAVCLALYVAFWLQLDNAQWAGTSAAIVCQPTLGASLRKGSFRVIGTVIGAVAIVVLTACFPQSRTGFLLGLALWGAACAFFAAILRNNTSYAAALAGYTAAIIASDLLGATGGANGSVLLLAIDRATSISIGIVCAGIVLAGTDFGGARQRLASQMLQLPRKSPADSRHVLPRGAGPSGDAAGSTRAHRAGGRARASHRRSDRRVRGLRYRVSVLRTAVDGLFAALSGWRTVANCLERMPNEQGRREADLILRSLPQALRLATTRGDAAIWAREPSMMCQLCRAAVRALVVLPAGTPTLRLMADATAAALLGMSHALDGLALLADPAGPVPRRRVARFRMPDPLPACIGAARVFVTLVFVELFWIVTAWPNGALAIAFAAISIILLSPQEDRAYAGAKTFMFGIALATVLAGMVKFGVLPAVQTFPGFCLAIGIVLVPVGALSFQSWQGPVFALTATVFFIPLLAPANQMTYDTKEFYNIALAIFDNPARAPAPRSRGTRDTTAAQRGSCRSTPPAPPARRRRRATPRARRPPPPRTGTPGSRAAARASPVRRETAAPRTEAGPRAGPPAASGAPPRPGRAGTNSSCAIRLPSARR